MYLVTYYSVSVCVTAKKGGQYGPVFCPYFPQRRYSIREIYGITTGTVDARNGNKLHRRARREPSISPFLYRIYSSIFPLYTVTARRFLPKVPCIIPYLLFADTGSTVPPYIPCLSSCNEYHYYIQRWCYMHSRAESQ